MYRRSLGFRQYMTVAETDRQRFNEETNLFQEYLPYAIVYGCVDKWAQAFEGLANQPDTSSWYVASHAFAPLGVLQQPAELLVLDLKRHRFHARWLRRQRLLRWFVRRRRWRWRRR